MRRSLRSWLWRVPVAQEVDDELAFHLEMRTRDLTAAGLDPDEARRQAAARLGDLAALKRTCVDLGRRRDREFRVMQWLGEFRHDVVFALRQMRATPAFTLVAALTLALGIGANSAIFALVDATLLRPLPFRDPASVVVLSERTPSGAQSRVSPLNLADWTEGSAALVQSAGYMPGIGGMVMRGVDGTAETVPRQWVSSGFFEVLGVPPLAGRLFRAGDDWEDHEAVVLTEAYWRSRFNADPAVVGRDLVLDGEPYRVLGVAPGWFRWTDDNSIWALIRMRPQPRLRTVYLMRGLGRLAPGATIERARAEVEAVAAELARTLPENRGRGVTLTPVREAIVGRDLQATSMLFLGVVGFVLLICCANVANLLLARATARGRELAIRAALGAGRGRVARQLLTESLVLAAIGGALGAAVAWAVVTAAPALVPAGVLPASVAITFDARVVAFCAVAALVVGVVFGMAPAWQAGDLTSARFIAADTRTTTGGGGRLRGALAVTEVAVSVLLLVGAGLLLRTLLAVQSVDRGYRADDVLTMVVDPLASRYPTDEALQQFYDEVATEVAAVPGVGAVAWASTLPLGSSLGGSRAFGIVGDPPRDGDRRPLADYQVVSHSYFTTLDLPVVTGRAFTDRDTRQSPQVCIVNEAFVRRELGGRDPVGIRVALTPPNAPDATPVVREIVGVARQVKGRPDETDDLVQIYVPMTQSGLDDTYLLVRPSTGEAVALAPAVRAAIGRVDTAQLVSVGQARTLDDVADTATSAHRFRAVLVVAFAALALVLAMVGVFGILAYSVQQRTADFAVRRAMGATSRDVVRLVAGSAARVILAGAAIGVVLAAGATRWLTSVLYGVAPLDPITFLWVGVVLATTATLAVAAPAWRAVRVDPAVTLRSR
ncbi:MAG: ADOP family duplicated permease [Vicinamibacterales bacterium]